MRKEGAMKNFGEREASGFAGPERTENVAPEARDGVWVLLDEWNAGEPAPDFDATVLARIRAEDRPEFQNGWMDGLVAWFRGMDAMRGFGLAGALATVVFAAMMLREPAVAPEVPLSQAASQELSAQQVELALEDLRMLDELYSPPAPEENHNKKI